MHNETVESKFNDKCRCGIVGTMKHVLSNCSLALDRYKWRHEKVLRIVFYELEKQIALINSGGWPTRSAEDRQINFFRVGHSSHYK